MSETDLRLAAHCALNPCRHPACFCPRVDVNPLGIKAGLKEPTVLEKHVEMRDVHPGKDESQKQIIDSVADMMKRKPVSIVIYVELESGVAGTYAVGTPLALRALENIGRQQLINMIGKALEGGENG